MMTGAIEYFVKRPLLANLLAIFVLAAGVSSLWALKREAFPNVNFDIVTVRTDYTGAPPEEVEKLVSTELEDKLKEVSGFDEMVSVSSENMSLIVIKIDPDEKNKAKVVNDIQRAADRSDELPEEAEDPQVEELQTKDLPIINVSLSGDISEGELQKLARNLEIQFLDLPEVARVDRMGWRDREIWVEVDPELVNSYRLSLQEIIEALKKKNRNIPGGNLATQEGDYLIRTIGEFETVEQIEDVIIRANDTGNWIRVKDVARVKDAFEDDQLIERTRGNPAINLTVVKREKGDIVRLVNQIRKISGDFEKEWKEKIRVSFFDDFSFYVRRRLDVLRNNGLIGTILVTVTLLIFMARNAALMTALGVPVALCATFFMMHMFGLTINLITMFGLIMVLGMIVDDAIVVSENVYRHIEDGVPPHQAAIRGTAEVTGPVIATVLTTVVAFIPLFFMSGIIGKYIRTIPFVVIVALLASLIECLLVLPSHLAETAQKGDIKKQDESHWFFGLREIYIKTLRWVVGHRYKAVGIFAAAFFATLLLFFLSMKFILFPQGMIEEFFIKAKAPVGTSLEDMGNRMRRMEEILSQLSENEIENYVTQVGIIREDPTDPYSDRGSHLAQLHVYLTAEQGARRRTADQIIDELRKKTEPFKQLFDEITFEKLRSGPPVGKPVSVRLGGDDLTQLKKAALEFQDKLRSMKGLKDIQDDFTPGKTELRVEVHETAAAKAYLTIQDIAASVRNAIDGGVATTIRKTDEEIDVIVRYPESLRDTRAVFDKIYVPNKFGNLVPLVKIASLREKAGIHAIKHLDRKRMIHVTANIDEDKISPIEAERAMRKFYEEKIKAAYPGIIMRFGGEQEETRESLRDFLNALLLAVFMIFIILAVTFNSLTLSALVMSAIPFGLMGVILTFFLHGKPLSFMALLGLLGLSGVVVNDSIVLVSFINELRRQGLSRFESILQAGKLRLRPVILTSVTTVAGLLPVAYGIGGSDPFLKPMALAVGWGLAFSTILTLLLVPCLYTVSDDLSVLGRKLWLRFTSRLSRHPALNFMNGKIKALRKP